MSANTPPIRPTDERLARLAERSAAHRANRPSVGPVPGAPLAPPVVGAASPAAPAPSSRTTAPRAPKRRHAARGSRAMALALSVGTTVGLAGWFKVLGDDNGAVASGSEIAGGAAAASSAGATPVSAASVPAQTATAGTTAAPAGTTAAPAGPPATSAAAGATTRATTPAAPATTAVAPAAATGAGLAAGTWTGAASSTRWGPVQVAVTVAAGRISAVNVLQFPNRDNKSVSINNRALPTLVSETMTAQSARVDSVSGATYTSASYRASLQSALDAARAATASR